jgi:hypothetical protein
MGHQAPKPAVAAGIPSMKWPLAWLALTTYIMLACFIDFTIDREEDWLAAFMTFPFCALFFVAALGYYRHRIRQREQWRQRRFIEVLHRYWPPPVATDWEKFELDIAKHVAKQERKQAKGVAQVVITPPGRSNHSRGGMYWDKRDLMRGDWWAR